MTAPLERPDAALDFLSVEETAELRARYLRTVAAWQRAGLPIALDPRQLDAIAQELDTLAARARSAP
jgi:hypothetical protein